MQKTHLNIDQRIVTEASLEFHLAYGLALSRWALVEAALFDWFRLATKTHDKMARAVFYSAKSFNARAEMLEAAVDASLLTSETVEFVKAVIKKAWAYSSFRNQITHGEMLLNVRITPDASAHYTLVQGKDIRGGGITIADLSVATTNFHNLRQLAIDMLPLHRGEHVRSPAEHLARVLALPKLANSKSDPIPSKTEKPPQPQHRDKKAYRAAQAQTRK